MSLTSKALQEVRFDSMIQELLREQFQNFKLEHVLDLKNCLVFNET